MIVLDEQLADPRLSQAIARWYEGKVINITEARPDTLILDDVIATLLHSLKAPTFVTINHKDFWRKLPANRAYCAICLKLPIERSLEVADALRKVLQQEQWKTKQRRMGKVLLVSGSLISYYQ